MQQIPTEFTSQNIDVILASILSLLLPFLCAFLFEITGAFLPLLLYYGVGCIVIPYWRKKTLNYNWPHNWALPLFIFLVIVQVITQWAGFQNIIYIEESKTTGVLLTLLLWAPVNAFMEQILWIYIFEAFANRFESKRKKIFSSIGGGLMSLIFVGLIHALFWNQFLMQFGHKSPFYEIFFISQFIITPGYILLYRKTHSMTPIFFIHLIADITAVLGANYSIIPYLFNF
ncbi:MAG: hypothetical protein ACOC44_04510 [Promethearchaeia archaeon]